jgi:tetratricopeptide (TPR) repeat protein
MEEYRLAKASSDAYGTCSTLINLGDYYYLQNRLEEARQSFESAYEIALKHDYDTDQVYIEVNLGNILDLTSDLKAALKYYNLALSKAQNSASSRYLPQIHNNMGNLYLKVGSFAKASSIISVHYISGRCKRIPMVWPMPCGTSVFIT